MSRANVDLAVATRHVRSVPADSPLVVVAAIGEEVAVLLGYAHVTVTCRNDTLL